MVNYRNKIIGDINREDFNILTDRLFLVPVKEKEADVYYREFNDEVTKFQYASPFKSKEEAKNLIKNFVVLAKMGMNLMLSIYDKKNNFVGSIELYGLNKDIPEIGIWICKKFWNKGFGYEALKGVNDYMKKLNLFDGIIYETDKRNISSIALINKFNPIYVNFNEVISDSGEILKLNKYIIK